MSNPAFSAATVANGLQRCSSKSGGMLVLQYARIVLEIIARAPANVLVFGAGADTAMYVDANPGGRTVVLERHAKWLDAIQDVSCESFHVHYSTVRSAGVRDHVTAPEGMPWNLLDVPWDVIIVDGPEGHTDTMPGRQQSLFAASLASKNSSVLFVHDYQRDLERQCCDRYLGSAVEEIGQQPSLAVFDGATVSLRTAGDSAESDVPPKQHPLMEVACAGKPVSRLQGSSRPVVSVVIPTHDEGDWLKRTVHSVLAAKSDTAYEIVIFDDASTDGSVDVVRNLDGVNVVSACELPVERIPDWGKPRGDHDESRTGQAVGCIVGRNAGAEAASGDYLCFLDSHVLVQDHWLDHLLETSRKHGDRCLVSGNILNVDNLGEPNIESKQFGYTLRDWGARTTWHYYGLGRFETAYETPLCPGGLMFTSRRHFDSIGGFSEHVRWWGGTDAEISLKNYMLGGVALADPLVAIYHYYKNITDRKPSFKVSYRDTFFNRLFIMKAFSSQAVFDRLCGHYALQAKMDAILADVHQQKYLQAIEAMQATFVRTWDQFATQFASQLKQLPIQAG
ncbi:glycosyltransferase [Rosistilla carotiformis]|nr:glycosyltransferase [Rosistilla carotiformis]